MHIFEREIDGRGYRIAAQSVWNPRTKQPISRQVVLGPVAVPAMADLSRTRTVGTRRVGDVGALVWLAEQLDVVGHIDRACQRQGALKGPTLGEMVLAVAVQRACAPAAKRELADFLGGSIPRLSCLPAEAFSGQAFYRAAAGADEQGLEAAQLAIAHAAVARFALGIDVLEFDTTNFDTHIATTTKSDLARRGHAKSKRADLRVVGLGLLVSETGHVPLLHRTYPGNGSDQSVLTDCLDGLRHLHEQLDDAERRKRPAERTIVRDGGSWSPQLELDLHFSGYHTLISLPLGHTVAQEALEAAAKRGAMKHLDGRLEDVRAARVMGSFGGVQRTLVVVESLELLEGQKRGIAVALRKAKAELNKLAGLAEKRRIGLADLERRASKALAREHLSEFVVVAIEGTERAPKLRWRVDAGRRRRLEKTRLGRRVLYTDQHAWSTPRIVTAFRGQWNVEEMFRRTKKGGVVPWGPSYQWATDSLRLHTFATVLGLTLVSLARLTLATRASPRAMMRELGALEATMVRTTTGQKGRRPTVLIPPELSALQRKAVATFELDRWMPALSSTMTTRPAPRRAG
jgi:transposase